MPARADPGQPAGDGPGSGQPARSPLLARLWASRWPEVAWTLFAIGNLAWMVLVPAQSLLPFHFTWISLLLLYGLGYRSYTKRLTWFLLVPVMAGAVLLFADARIRALQPYDELHRAAGHGLDAVRDNTAYQPPQGGHGRPR